MLYKVDVLHEVFKKKKKTIFDIHHQAQTGGDESAWFPHISIKPEPSAASLGALLISFSF